jgi:GNAT superfamily N-acetyltransferase
MVTQIPTRVTIRPFATEDYEAALAVSNAVYSEYANTVEEWRYSDEHRDPKCYFARYVAERDGEIVAIGECGQNAGMFHPRKFFIGVTVHPDWQGQGIGTSLYDHISSTLETFSPLSFRASTRDAWSQSLNFLAARGYEERMRSWESRLDVAAFDPTPYGDPEARAVAGGIAFTTYDELVGDPERDRKLYELDLALSHDVPHPEPITPISFEFYAARVLHDPDLLPDGWFVAVDRATGQYVGMCQLWHSQASDDLYNGLTGVLRSHRRRGIALALKLRSIAYAKTKGRPTIKTWNESNNRAMLSINEALGFVKQPAWIDFVKVLRTDDETAPVAAGEAEG